MSRAIKFRAWHKLTKYPRWYNVDYLHFDPDGSLYGILVDAKRELQAGNLLAVTDFELMQFTGLIDKHGKEIFEGDIVKGNNAWDNEGDRFQVVRYECGTWNYSYALHEYAEHPERDWEVVGNIYETPELLEQIKESK